MKGVMKYYKIWLPFLSIAIFVGLAELICRVIVLTSHLDTDFKFYINNVDDDLWERYNVEDAFLMWAPKPHYQRGNITINSQGIRDKEYTIQKDKNVFRILCLGDSSTFGYGVNLEDTYHSLLEDRLNREFGRTGIRFEVINAGVTGYTSSQGLAFYKLKGFKYKPDIVTFYFGINERVHHFYLSDKEIMHHNIPAQIKAAMEKSLLLKLQSYRFLRNFLVNIVGIRKNAFRGRVPRVSLADFQENILELDRLCKKNGSRLLLISPPLNKQKDPEGHVLINIEIAFYKALLKNVARDYQIPLIEIPEMTEESPLDTAPFFSDTVHPSPLGHRVIMEKLYQYLTTHAMLPNSPPRTNQAN
jgi:lysophospholipase L1-like esterase